MNLFYHPFTLELKNDFTIAHGTRKTTPIVITRLEHNGKVGYGEASLPPYYKETQDSVTKFLDKLDMDQFNDPLQIDDILDYVDGRADGNNAAKAAVDIALHDLMGKTIGKPLFHIWKLNPLEAPLSTFTIATNNPDLVSQKLEDAAQFEWLKVKLGFDTDRQIIETIRVMTDKPIIVDVNQGWTNVNESLKTIEWLATQNVVAVEQPFGANEWKKYKSAKPKSVLPIIADESFMRLADLDKVAEHFHGINVKLIKCTGLREARKIMQKAREMDLKIMIGCMSESTCAVTAAAHISPMADWADLDGPALIKNDPFQSMKYKDGIVAINEMPGLGISKLDLKALTPVAQ